MPVFIRGIFGGGGKIKDATAVPSDVMKGKVFYNNDGRQIGSSESLKTGIFNVSTSNLGSNNYSLSCPEVTMFTVDTYDNNVHPSGNKMPTINYCQRLMIENLLFIYGVKVNGKIFHIPCLNVDSTDNFSMGFSVTTYLMNRTRTYFECVIHNSEIFIIKGDYNSDLNFEILYTTK